MSIKQLIRLGYGLITIILVIVVIFGVRLTNTAEGFLATIANQHQISTQQTSQIKSLISKANYKFDLFIKQDKIDNTVFDRLIQTISNNLQRLETTAPALAATRKDIPAFRNTVLHYAQLIESGSSSQTDMQTLEQRIAKQISTIRQQINQLPPQQTPLSPELSDLSNMLIEVETRLEQYKQRVFITPNEVIAPLIQIKNTLLDMESEITPSLNKDQKDQQILLQAIANTRHSINKQRALYYQFMEEWHALDPATSQLGGLLDEVRQMELRSNRQIDALATSTTRYFFDKEQQMISRLQQDQHRFITLGTLALLFAPLSIFIISRLLSSPFETLLRGTRIIAQGNYQHRIAPPKQKEFKELADDFNKMADAIAERTTALEDREQKYRLLAENSPDMIYRLSLPDGTYEYVSPAANTIFGYPPEAWYQSPHLIQRVVHPDWSAFISQCWRNLQQGKPPPTTCEYQIIHKNGSLRWIEQRNILIHDEDDHPIAAIGIITDITHKKQLENELRESNQRFRTLFELSPDPAWIIDNYHFVECNQAAVAMLGYPSKDTLLNVHPSALSPTYQPGGEPSYEKSERMMEIALEQGSHRFEWVHTRADKSDFYAEVTLSAITLQDHPVIYCVWRDITERKIAEGELEAYRRDLEQEVANRTRETKELMHYNRMLFETSPIGLALSDMDGKLIDINPAYLKITGYSEEEAKRLTYWQITPRKYEKQEGKQLRQLEETGRYGPYEKEYIHKDGHLVPVLLNGLVIKRKEKPYIWSSVEDITQRKAYEKALTEGKEQAEAAAKAKATFLANMSHEIRTPLNAILGLSKMGLRTKNEQNRQRFQRIVDSGRHLLDIVNDILDLSKLEADKLMINNHPFDLIDTLQQSIAQVANQAAEKGLQLVTDFDPDLPTYVEGDAIRLRQILINLLSNAVKFTDAGRILLAARPQGDEIAFLVKDEGIGMNKAQVDNLFIPFQQADDSTTRRFGGTGLGLAISHNLIQLMGGTIEVTSQPDQGSEFTVTLPLPERQPTPTQENAPSPPQQRLHGLHILAAEDVELNQVVLEDILVSEGAEPVFADNGEQALEQLARHGADYFDVVLMDIQMPVMDGYTATQKIGEISPDLPVIGLTAHALAEERQRSLEAGMVDHITKPIDEELLVSTILKHT